MGRSAASSASVGANSLTSIPSATPARERSVTAQILFLRVPTKVDDALRADRHVARVGNERVEIDMEPGRQLDLA